MDLADHMDLEASLAGPGGGPGVGCDCFDFDVDGDVTIAEFAEFQLRLPQGRIRMR